MKVVAHQESEQRPLLRHRHKHSDDIATLRASKRANAKAASYTLCAAIVVAAGTACHEAVGATSMN